MEGGGSWRSDRLEVRLYSTFSWPKPGSRQAAVRPVLQHYQQCIDSIGVQLSTDASDASTVAAAGR